MELEAATAGARRVEAPMTARTRSEYRLILERHSAPKSPPIPVSVEPPVASSLDVLAVLLLDAYRGTVDDEGETLVEAREAMSAFFARHVPEYSVVLRRQTELLAFSFVVIEDGLHYIDPVVTAATCKRQGLATIAVSTSLDRLHEAQIREVGAVITDGNTASEALFAKLGFTRFGTWI